MRIFLFISLFSLVSSCNESMKVNVEKQATDETVILLAERAGVDENSCYELYCLSDTLNTEQQVLSFFNNIACLDQGFRYEIDNDFLQWTKLNDSVEMVRLAGDSSVYYAYLHSDFGLIYCSEIDLFSIEKYRLVKHPKMNSIEINKLVNLYEDFFRSSIQNIWSSPASK